MTPERWQQLQRLFDAAQLLSSGERLAFLERSCDGDQSLRGALEVLLAGHDKADRDDFLHLSGANTPVEAADSPTLLTEPGQRIGPYELRQLLGSGGMGRVYRAVRVADYRQEVALKMIRLGLEGEDLIRRFHTERQSLADLSHPYIARLLDGGVSEDARPYLVMEYVPGEPITRYCEARQLKTAQSIRLFHKVCQAVAHAHGRGILHRDLKPDNVLVTAGPEDGSPGVPKVVDFGLARRFGPADTSGQASGQTGAGAILGTPSYMAPEQASCAADSNVGPAADVYALGAILYELLTGRPPFRGPTAVETVFQVLHDEPVRPGKLHAGLARDLETICLKCLEKEPAKRYANAAELADDIGRYLAGEPVHARPISLLERTWRWCRRNQRVAALMALLVGVMVVSFATVTALWQLAENRRSQAEDNYGLAEERRVQAEDNYHLAEDRRQQAEAGLNLAQEAVESSQILIHLHPDLRRPEFLAFRFQMLETALSYYKRLLKVRPDSLSVLNGTAMTFMRLSEVREAQQRRDEAREAAREALAIHERLGDKDGVAWCYERLGILEDDPKAKSGWHERARKIREELADKSEGPVEYKWAQARSCYNLALTGGKLPDGNRAIDRAVELQEEVAKTLPTNEAVQSDLALFLELLAWVESSGFKKNVDRALEASQRALQIRTKLVKPKDQDLGLQEALAGSYHRHGQILNNVWRFTEAEKSYRQARDELAKLEEKLCKSGTGTGKVRGMRIHATYELASNQALQAALVSDDEMKKRLLDEAMTSLKEAVGLGFKDVNQLKASTRFRVLKDREDFRKVLQQLENLPPPDKGP